MCAVHVCVCMCVCTRAHTSTLTLPTHVWRSEDSFCEPVLHVRPGDWSQVFRLDSYLLRPQSHLARPWIVLLKKLTREPWDGGSALAANPNDLSLIPRAHEVEEGRQVPPAVVCPSHLYQGIHLPRSASCPITQPINTFIIKVKKKKENHSFSWKQKKKNPALKAPHLHVGRCGHLLVGWLTQCQRVNAEPCTL